MSAARASKAQQQMKLIAPVAKVVELSSLAMTRMRAEVHLPTEEVTKVTRDLGITHRVTGRLDKDRKALEVLIAFDLAGLRAKDKKARTFEIAAEFRLDYVVKDGDPPDLSEEQIKAFAELNSVFNAWPYWREFVQTSTTRLGLPPLILPLRKVQIESALKAGTN